MSAAAVAGGDDAGPLDSGLRCAGRLLRDCGGRALAALLLLLLLLRAAELPPSLSAALSDAAKLTAAAACACACAFAARRAARRATLATAAMSPTAITAARRLVSGVSSSVR